MGWRPTTGKFQTFSPKSSVCRRLHSKSLELTCFCQNWHVPGIFAQNMEISPKSASSDVFTAKRSKFGKFQTFSIEGGRFGMFWAKLRVWTFLDKSVREVSGEVSGRRCKREKFQEFGRTTPKVAFFSKKNERQKKTDFCVSVPQ